MQTSQTLISWSKPAVLQRSFCSQCSVDMMQFQTQPLGSAKNRQNCGNTKQTCQNVISLLQAHVSTQLFSNSALTWFSKPFSHPTLRFFLFQIVWNFSIPLYYCNSRFCNRSHCDISYMDVAGWIIRLFLLSLFRYNNTSFCLLLVPLSTVYVKQTPPSFHHLALTKKAFSFGETFIQKQTDVMSAFT